MQSLTSSYNRLINGKSILFLLISAGLLLRVVFTWVSFSNLPVTSDEASAFLLADSISPGNWPLLFVGQPYQFPIESYLMAPFTSWLPHNVFGARYQTVLLGLLSLFGYLLIIREVFPTGSRWPALLIVIFPSAYFLTYQAAYAPPQYSMSLTMSWLSIFLVFKSRHADNRYFILLAGLTSGLSISNHMLALPITLGVSMIVLFDVCREKQLGYLVTFSLGLFIGLIPFLLAIKTIPGAYGNLPVYSNIPTTLHRLFNPALTDTFPGAMGIKPVLFPDFYRHLGRFQWIRPVFAYGFLALFCLLTIDRLVHFVRTIVGAKCPKLEVIDLSLVAMLATFIMFSSHFVEARQYRYLLPAVWVFPFIVGYIYDRAGRLGKWTVGSMVIGLVYINISTSLAVIEKWAEPGAVERFSDTPRLDNLLNALHARGIDRCYASFWLAYRITYESNGSIICALPYNERFPGWPIPFKDIVDSSTEAVYILTESFGARLKSRAFQQQLIDAGITQKEFSVGPFDVFHDFDYPPADGESFIGIPLDHIQASSGETGIEVLHDGDWRTGWVYPAKQKKGQWLEIGLSGLHAISGVTLAHVNNGMNAAKRFRILGSSTVGHDEWFVLADNLEPRLQRFRFINRHPVYGGSPQVIRFDPVMVNKLRIEIVEPNLDANWGMSEIYIHTRSDAKGTSE